MEEKGIKRILKELENRSVPKQDVFENTKAEFGRIKSALKDLVAKLQPAAQSLDKRLDVGIVDEDDYAIYLKIAGDTIVCSMHSNVFTFPKNHSIFKKPYIGEDPTRAYCGMITFHDFLSDSFRYKRYNDQGILIARLFLNRENHFFVEGLRQLGFLYNDIENMEMNEVYRSAIIENAILYSLEFELQVPPFENESQISVQEIKFITAQAGFSTNKTLGYEFSYMQNDQDVPES